MRVFSTNKDFTQAGCIPTSFTVINLQINKKILMINKIELYSVFTRLDLKFLKLFRLDVYIFIHSTCYCKI